MPRGNSLPQNANPFLILFTCMGLLRVSTPGVQGGTSPSKLLITWELLGLRDDELSLFFGAKKVAFGFWDALLKRGSARTRLLYPDQWLPLPN